MNDKRCTDCINHSKSGLMNVCNRTGRIISDVTKTCECYTDKNKS